jgi:hypothetical protein
MAHNLYSFTLQTVEIATGSPETVVNDATARNPVGAMVKWNGNVYRYVKFDNGSGNVASAAAGVLHWSALAPAADTPLYTATSDQTDALAGVNSVAGIAKGVVTDLYYTFIGVAGLHNATTSAATSAGMKVVGGTTDLTFDLLTAVGTTTYIPYGRVLVTSATTTSSVLLEGLIW